MFQIQRIPADYETSNSLFFQSETFSILGKLVPTETTQFIFLAHSLVRFKYSFFLHQIQCSSHFRPQLFSVVLNCNDHRRK